MPTGQNETFVYVIIKLLFEATTFLYAPTACRNVYKGHTYVCTYAHVFIYCMYAYMLPFLLQVNENVYHPINVKCP